MRRRQAGDSRARQPGPFGAAAPPQQLPPLGQQFPNDGRGGKFPPPQFDDRLEMLAPTSPPPPPPGRALSLPPMLADRPPELAVMVRFCSG